MEMVYERCCGVDVHKRTVVACLLTPGAEGQPTKEIRTFGTMTTDLLALSDWLSRGRLHPCRHGVHRRLLEADLQPVGRPLRDAGGQRGSTSRPFLGARPMCSDAEWIADLLRHGLLRASFIPDRPQRELRELTRYRTTLDP